MQLSARPNLGFILLFISASLGLNACGDGRVDVASPQACHTALPPNASVKIPGGTYTLGDTRFYREEAPVVTTDVAPFEIDAHEVTNRQFAAFVDATGYVTRAERGLPEADFNHLPDEERKAGSAVFVPPTARQPVSMMSWWRFVEGAHWRMPEGPGSSIEGRERYPVVHIAYEDARAYARWRGRRLPIEAEWEVAARGGLKGAPYAWGDTPPDALSNPAANTWQGLFPYVNENVDGHAGLAPVGCFAPNPFGLYDMIGNVWEWTDDAFTPRRDGTKGPESPERGTIKGGSFLCSDTYCQRYRPAARQPQERLFSTSHIGFRTVRSTG
ncbi:MAG: formylglycine-generating enzyme family protein [Pseudomonadota bacterium]